MATESPVHRARCSPVADVRRPHPEAGQAPIVYGRSRERRVSTAREGDSGSPYLIQEAGARAFGNVATTYRKTARTKWNQMGIVPLNQRRAGCLAIVIR